MHGHDDFLDPPEYEKVPDPQAASRSRADDILDAVDGVVPNQQVRTCPVCKGTDFQRRGPSVGGGVIVLKCRGCKLEIPLASVQSAVVPIMSEIVHAGPFYRDGAPRAKPDKNLPPNRVALERSKK